MSESQNIEYKESWRDEYLKWICGFANAQGGRIYIGIDDNQQVVGVTDTKRLMEDIPNKIVNYLGIVADVNLLHKEDKDYIEIAVQPCNLPIAYHGIYHYRSGSTKQELKGAALQQFLLRKMGHSWDDIENDRATLNDIDRQAIDFFLRKAVDAGRMPIDSLNETTEKVLSNLNLIGGEGKLRNAALLLFGKNPAKFFTSVQFRIGRFGRDEADLMFQDVVDGNIIQMTDRVIEVLKSKYLISPVHYEGLQRIEPLEIPEDALRESLFNSIVHKLYTGVHIQMKVYNDRIRLWNPGTLPEGMTIEQLLGDHASQPRNRLIAETFYRAGFIESWGRGIHKIYEGMTKAGLRKPEFINEAGGVTLIIYRPNTIKSDDPLNDLLNDPLNDPLKLSSLEKDILKLIVKDNQSTYDNLAISLSVSSATIKRAFRNLKVNGCIIRKGSKKIGYWIITEKGKSILS